MFESFSGDAVDGSAFEGEGPLEVSVGGVVDGGDVLSGGSSSDVSVLGDLEPGSSGASSLLVDDP